MYLTLRACFGYNQPVSDHALFRLDGRVALVTGGSRGLGRAMVQGFAEAGADVVIASRKFADCVAAAEEVMQTTGRRALPHACHVGHWDELDGLVDAAYNAFGRVDVLVNNAGMSPLYGQVVDVTERLWDATVGVNLKGPFRLTSLVGTRMAAAGRGSIINISTIGAIHPAADIIPYSASKAGLNAMTIAFAHAFGPSVRVNCIMPGGFRTDITKAWDWDAFNDSAKGFALRRIGEPHEIVGAALYLASDASSYTTGAVFPVDGGVPT
jgi:NAD(P)-dependent dehydrogenase (short-subunit alcohol dehydrogenase family)